MLAERLDLSLTIYSQDDASPRVNGAVIAVGYDAAVRAGLAPHHLAGLRIDDFIVSNSRGRGLHGGCLAVTSSSSRIARGALYGAFALLKALGWRFLTPSMTIVPSRPVSLPAGGVDIFDGPGMYLRDVTSATVQDNRGRVRNAAGQLVFPPANISAALGLSGANANLPVGGFEGAGTEGPPGNIATVYHLLVPGLDASSPTCAGIGLPAEPHPPATPCPATVREHPDWVVCRNSSGLVWPCFNTSWANTQDINQPCWGVPSLQAALADGVRAVMRLNPSLRVVDVSGLDGPATICPADAVLNAVENATGGANFHAVNNMAANLSAEFPSLSLQTLAYHGSRAPPARLRLRDDVQVRYVPDGWSKFQSLHHPSNAVYLAEARGWMMACKKMTVYDNTDNFAFTIAPWPNYYALPLHIKEFAALGFVGYYAAGYPLQGQDMADLKTFVAARVMWDPAGSNITALIEDFTDGVYGPEAAPGVRWYLRAMEASFQDNDKALDYRGYLNIRGASRIITIWNAVYANRTMVQCGRALKNAEAVATTPVYRDNVRQALLPLQYVVLMRWAQLRMWAAESNITWPFAETAAEEFDLFNVTFTRTKVVAVKHYDQFPAVTQTTCNLACLRLLMLGN